MRRLILAICCSLLLMTDSGHAQTFTVTDTAFGIVHFGDTAITGYIYGPAVTHVHINWKVVATDFPHDWLADSALGFCDNLICTANDRDAAGHYMQLWNDTTLVADTFTSIGYFVSDSGVFNYASHLTGATSLGCHWITVGFWITGSTEPMQRMTFYACMGTSAATPSVPEKGDVKLYPNPASDELNVTYDESADIKTIAIYNIIGKVMSVYKPPASNSSNLNVEGLPSGIYFLRLSNSLGQVVMTKKFTRQ